MKTCLAVLFLVASLSTQAKTYVCEGRTPAKQIVKLTDDRDKLDQIFTVEKYNNNDQILTTTSYHDTTAQVNTGTFKTFRIDRNNLMISIELVIDQEEGGPKLRYIERSEENGQYKYKRYGYFACKQY